MFHKFNIFKSQITRKYFKFFTNFQKSYQLLLKIPENIIYFQKNHKIFRNHYYKCFKNHFKFPENISIFFTNIHNLTDIIANYVLFYLKCRVCNPLLMFEYSRTYFWHLFERFSQPNISDL